MNTTSRQSDVEVIRVSWIAGHGAAHRIGREARAEDELAHTDDVPRGLDLVAANGRRTNGRIEGAAVARGKEGCEKRLSSGWSWYHLDIDAQFGEKPVR